MCASWLLDLFYLYTSGGGSPIYIYPDRLTVCPVREYSPHHILISRTTSISYAYTDIIPEPSIETRKLE